MELNYNCVRDILIFLEHQEQYTFDSENHIIHVETRLKTISEALPQYSENVIYYTLSRLDEAEFISITSKWASNSLRFCCVNYITYDGHEFLQKIKDDNIWKKTLGYAGKIGNFSLEMLARIATAAATAYFNQLFSGK